MSFISHVSPGDAVSGFRDVFRDAGPKRWPIALLAAAITFGMIASLSFEVWRKPRSLPEITYITTFPKDWTPAESRKFIEQNQRAKEQREAAEAAYEAEGRKLWEDLGRASGMDVDKIKQQADKDRAAEEAKKNAEFEALVKKQQGAAVGK
ncbi:MAG: hypothetical protein ACKOPE_01305 [Novosphingobium sp.]